MFHVAQLYCFGEAEKVVCLGCINVELGDRLFVGAGKRVGPLEEEMDWEAGGILVERGIPMPLVGVGRLVPLMWSCQDREYLQNLIFETRKVDKLILK